ncbi:MAG: phytoene desaturase, partial [Armatimonadetes bacterium]|nr:phytoene desaturase [Armatimonadota bacterium]
MPSVSGRYTGADPGCRFVPEPRGGHRASPQTAADAHRKRLESRPAAGATGSSSDLGRSGLRQRRYSPGSSGGHGLRRHRKQRLRPPSGRGRTPRDGLDPYGFFRAAPLAPGLAPVPAPRGNGRSTARFHSAALQHRDGAWTGAARVDESGRWPGKGKQEVSTLHIAVVGGGLGGSAAAVRLAAAGHRVTLLDSNPHLGGKMNLWESQGYSFDMGPTIITMPAVLERLFASAGRRVSEYLEMVSLDPQWRCLYADGTRLDLHARLEPMRAELARISGADAAAYPDFMAFCRRMYEISEQYFFHRPYGSISDLLKDRGIPGRDGLRLSRELQPLASLHTAICRHFGDPHVIQLFDHFVQYVGSSPFLAPAVLSLIAWAQMDQGVWYPMGGTRRIAESLGRLADELGVKRRHGAVVEQILLDETRVTGVGLTGGERIAADRVVSNCDVLRTYSELLTHPAARRLARRRQRLEPACSGVVLYLGCDRTWDHLLHHDFLFSADPEAEFRDIYDRRVPARDMTLYVAVPSVTDPSVAPPGHSSLYVLVHTPYLNPGVDWSQEAPGYREAILDRLEEGGLVGIRKSIRTERMLTPVDIERLYRSTRGSIYGLATRKGLCSAFKPGNRCPRFQGLYFAGGSVNPGAG